MAFTTARAFCKLSFGSLQNGLAPGANIGSLVKNWELGMRNWELGGEEWEMGVEFFVYW